ncbi:MAG: spore coat U domain-containing protein [Idiomarina sp.]|nr:spore coat U domain-containing protein [Idiomarina sp.]
MFTKCTKKILTTPALVLSSCLFVFNASADVSGTIDATLTLSDGCVVNGDLGSSDVSFGGIDFGAQSAIFDEVEGQVLGGGGSNGIEILCSPGVNATFVIQSGLHDGEGATGQHAMKHAAENDYIGYTLFSDAARTTSVELNTPLVLPEFTGTAQTLELWGTAWGNGAHNAGVYTDTLTVLLEVN